MLLTKNLLNLSIEITKSSLKNEFKPQFHYAMIENGIMWVTDAYRMIKCPLELEEVSTDIDSSERLYIHHKQLKAILKRKAKYGNRYEIINEDFSDRDDIRYPNLDQLITDQKGFKSAGGNLFRDSFFSFSHGPKFAYVEFAKHEESCLQSASHEREQSTYANVLADTEDLAATLKETIKFDSEFLGCMSDFPFDSAKFNGDYSLHLRHSDGHEALIMGIKSIYIDNNLRHPRFKWI